MDFTGVPGWRNQGAAIQDYVKEDYLALYLPDALFELITRWTNDRAAIMRRDLLQEGKELKWNDVTTEEMKKFVGLTFQMGIVKKPEIRDYWATDLMMSTPYYLHEKSPSRNRYIAILKFLRFNDPYLADPKQKMSRVQGILDAIHAICKQWNPDKDLSVDETLLLFKGRLSCKQFVRIKRARFGVKSYVLTDANGYLLYFHPYVGAETDLTLIDEEGATRCNLSKSERVVVYLLEKADLLDKGHITSCDNWYSSVRLAKYLWSRKTGMRGTIRPNRGIPVELKTCKVEPGETKFMRKGEVLAMRYADKKDVYLISTVEKAELIEKTRILPGNKQVVQKKPLTVCNYNLKMNGVDLADQLIAPYDCTRRSHAWFKKVGFNLLQRLSINAYIRFCQDNNKIPLKVFQKTTIVLLTGIPSEPKKPGSFRRRPAEHPQAAAVGNDHRLARISATAKKRYPTKPCQVCSKNKIRKESRYACIMCPSKPGLCMDGQCFDNFPGHQAPN